MKTVIVTGASKGIGAAVVRSLRSRGCRVVGVARNEAKLKLLGSEKQGTGVFEYVAGDVCDKAVLARAVQLATGNNGSLDGLVINAGVATPIERAFDVDMDEFKRAFDVNFFSGVELCKLALPHLRASCGRIVFTSTGVAEMPMAAWSSYCSSKAAMNMFLKCLAQEEPSIVSMCVRPGIVDTDILDSIYSDHGAAVMDRDQFHFMKLQKEKGKLLRPEQPADAMARLVLDAEKGLSGQFFAWDDVRLNAP